MKRFSLTTTVALLLASTGCRSGNPGHASIDKPVGPAPAVIEQAAFEAEDGQEATTQPSLAQPGSVELDEPRLLPEVVPTEAGATPESIPAPPTAPTLDELADSVMTHFPAIRQAIAARIIASGETLAAMGAFDHKLAGDSYSKSLGFYENYRHGLGLKRDTYWGGQTFAGYRIGRGIYEPWYLERETNKGGEFKAGFLAPLVKDRDIDANRAELWRAQLERSRVEPEIRAMVIGSVRDASFAYWDWVAAAENYRIAQGVLELGVNRRAFLEDQISFGEKARIDRVDNSRIILTRQAKAVDARRKLQQTAIKLSLFLRDPSGQPVVLPLEAATVRFPDVIPPEQWGAEADTDLALANRPELEELRLVRRQLNVALQQARNETLPEIDAGLIAAQDIGEPTSSKRDKSELELEAVVMLSVPLERRKALGKIRQLRGKVAQVRAKTQFVSDKISAEARASHAALVAAAQRVAQTAESYELAVEMQQAEDTFYRSGQSTLFNLNLREKQAAEAAQELVAAQYDYHVALADYAAALGYESSDLLTPVEP